ncbi:L-type lectin-domain containing receptor kinase IV.1-like [Panicum miliaceum]|uniref:non-specific serine/threonine protein kinase n=1 Tax=Panicum miliaceum TaxID=4540 RepID=A0A3L6TUG2_PANMI|nr:L-type lectin-domain containing receptor kinase IV.1-like [Panicum miliaceum]
MATPALAFPVMWESSSGHLFSNEAISRGQLVRRPVVPVLLSLLARGGSAAAAGAAATEFVFPGFARDNVTISGAAAVTASGLLRLTNETNEELGHGFYPAPLRFKDASTGAPLSFSTTFVVAILPRYPDAHGHGLAFALAPSATVPGAIAGKNLGLFNTSNHLGDGRSGVVAVELDTAMDEEFSDVNDNHVGVDVNSLKSNCSKPAGYVDAGTGKLTDLSLVSGDLLQVWIEYDGASTRLEVTVSPAGVPRPAVPLVSCTVNLSPVVADGAYVGFSAANGAASSSHYVLGWSFRLGGVRAPDLELSKLPRAPSFGPKKTMHPQLLLELILFAVVSLLVVSAGIALFVVWRRRFAEEEEDWEIEYGPHRISYKDLHPRLLEGREDQRRQGDPRIGKCDEDDLELILKLGLLCSHPDPQCRPSMRQVVQILEGAAPAPVTPPEDLGSSGRIFGFYEGFDEFVNMLTTTTETATVTTQPPSSRSSDEHQKLISG